MLPPKVLIIGDNAESAGIWRDALRHRGIESIHLPYGVQPPTLSLPDPFNLVLIDSHEADTTALVICAGVRTRSDKPILLLTPTSDERYQLKAYAAGVDECIVAPVSIPILLAKLHVWLHRGAAVESVREEISHSGFRLNPKTRLVVTPDGKAVKLSVQELRLLQLLMANPGRVLHTDLLISRLWSRDIHGSRPQLMSLVYRLRQKLAPRSSPGMYIQSIPGEGYKWASNGAEDDRSSGWR